MLEILIPAWTMSCPGIKLRNAIIHLAIIQALGRADSAGLIGKTLELPEIFGYTSRLGQGGWKESRFFLRVTAGKIWR